MIGAFAPTRLIDPHDAPHNGGRAWLITFTDLVALMLTFFVMLFAMSRVEQQKWEELIGTLTQNPAVLGELAANPPRAALAMEEEPAVAGSDLDYLAPLLRQQMAADPLLTAGTVERLSDRIIISLPTDLLFAPGSDALDPGASRAVFALGGALQNLANRIEVVGHADPTPPGGAFASNWELSLARAMTVAHLLSRAGLEDGLIVRGHGDAHFARIPSTVPDARRRMLARRVDIVAYERTENP